MNRNGKTTIKRGKGMRKPFILLAATALIALLASCGDSVVEGLGGKGSDVANKTASVTVYFRDGVGGGDISDSSVTVTLFGGGASRDYSFGKSPKPLNDSTVVGKGYVTFNNVPVGKWSARVTKPGYSTFFIDSILIANNTARYYGPGGETSAEGVTQAVGQDVYLPEGAAVVANLYSKTAVFEATVYYEKPDGGKAPAEGVIVELTLTDVSIADRVFTATTNRYGKAVIGDASGDTLILPAGVPYSVAALGGTPKGSGIAFKTTKPIGGPALAPNFIVTPASELIVYDEVLKNFYVVSYDLAVGPEDDIKIAFDNDIDPSITFGSVVVYPTADTSYKYPRKLYIDDEDPSVLVISPLKSWALSEDNTDEFAFDEVTIRLVGVYSVDGLKSEANKVLKVGVRTEKSGFVLLTKGSVIVDSTGTNSRITLQFSEDLDLGTVTEGTIVSLSPDQPYTVAFPSNNKKTVRIEPVEKWTANFELTVDPSAILKSVVGDALSPKSPKISVTLNDELTPFVLWGNDTATTTGIFLDDSAGVVTLSFNKAIKTTKVDLNNVVAIDSQDYKIEYDDDETLLISPIHRIWSGDFKIVITDLVSEQGSKYSGEISVKLPYSEPKPFVLVGADTIFTLPSGLVIEDSLSLIVLEFSNPIDTAKVNFQGERLVTVNSSGKSNQAAEVKFTNGLTTLEIKPYASTGWVGRSLTVVLHGTFVSKAGKALPSGQDTIPVTLKKPKVPLFVYTGEVEYKFPRSSDGRTLTLTFSDDIDWEQAKFENSVPLRVYRTDDNHIIKTNLYQGLIVEKKGGDAIEVKPVTGNWDFVGPNGPDTVYLEFTRDLISVNNDTLKSGDVRITLWRPGINVTGLAVTGLEIDSVLSTLGGEGNEFNGSSVRLRWDAVEYATSYNVYRLLEHPSNTDTTNVWKLYNNTAAANAFSGKETYVVRLGQGRNVFRVQPVRGSSAGTLDGDTVDVVTKPTVLAQSGDISKISSSSQTSPTAMEHRTHYLINGIVADRINNEYTTDTTFTFVLSFSEDMKTDAAHTPSQWTISNSGALAKFSVTPEWTSRTQLLFKINVDAGDDRSNGAVREDFWGGNSRITNLESAAGEKLFVYYPNNTDLTGKPYPITRDRLDVKIEIPAH